MEEKGTQKPRAYLILSGDGAIHSSKAGTNGKAVKMLILRDWLLLAITKFPILLNPIMSGRVSLGQNHHFCSQLMPVLLLLFIVYTADKPEGCSIVSMTRKICVFIAERHFNLHGNTHLLSPRMG